MDEETRKDYFKRIDLIYSPADEVELRRKERARRQVENGVAVKRDKLAMEKWDQAAKTWRERRLKKVEAGESTRTMARFDRDVRISRIDTILRREVRREMEEESGRESGKGEEVA